MPKTMETQPPGTADELRAAIIARFDTLSKRLQHVARFVLDHPDEVALETLTTIALRSGAQPSAIVRFAQSLGFSGSSPMQRLLRSDLLANNPQLGYGERIRRFNDTEADGPNPGALLDAFVAGDLLALGSLRDGYDPTRLEHAVEMIDDAEHIYLCGMRRSFPVAAYLAYALLRGGKPAELLDNAGGLSLERARLLDASSLLIAISFKPYASETVAICEAAAARGAKILAITDSLLGPLTQGAAEVLLVKEAEVRGFRSLSATMCLAQTLVVSLAWRRESRARPDVEHQSGLSIGPPAR